VPAFATVGISLTIIATVDEDEEQGELEMVHAKIFVPKPKLVIEEVGESELVIVPDPEIKAHTPVPIVAVLAVITVAGEEIQSVWLAPAFEAVGRSLTSIDTVDVELAQGGFEMVHAKTLVPTPNPKIVDVADSELLITPLPETKVHAPVPTTGVFADMIALEVLMQIV
jgi:hypothetical protein